MGRLCDWVHRKIGLPITFERIRCAGLFRGATRTTGHVWGADYGMANPSISPVSSTTAHAPKLEHGGRLRQAAKAFDIPLDEWLDLSTGINPHGWPVHTQTSLSSALWQRLPEDDDALLDAARRYYGSRHLLPVAGSQAAILNLPRLLREIYGTFTVICLQPLYNEHPAAWSAAGHIVEHVKWHRFQDGMAGLTALAPDETALRSLSEEALSTAQAAGSHPHALLLCNPNNPSGHVLPAESILALARQLAAQGGWLIVDEAFADSRPELSVAAYAGTYAYPRLIVLRSLGKFFGLAGLRVGFVCAAPALLQDLDQWLGPWTISTPARHIAALALSDSVWQAMTQTRLQADRERLSAALSPLAALDKQSRIQLRATDLFVWLRPRMDATVVYEQLAQAGILVRLFADTGTLRFGLPASEAHWARLQIALAELC